MKNKSSYEVSYDFWHKAGYQLDLEKSLQKSRDLHALIVQQLGLSTSDKDKKILDIACAKGLFLKDLERADLGLNLYGLDISEFAISKAKEFVEAKFVAANGEELPYEDDFFDYITCLGGLEYYTDPQKGVSEIYRVLKKNGKVCVQVPNLMFIGHIFMAWRYGLMPSEGAKNKNAEFYSYMDEKLYTYQGWKDLLEKGGLKISTCVKYNYISNTDKVSPFVKFLYNKVLQHFVPLNLSYCFVLVCQKS